MSSECQVCNRRYKEYRTPEERLYDAIFGREGSICKPCRDLRDQDLLPVCPWCNLHVPRESETSFNGQPYHSYCLAEALKGDQEWQTTLNLE